MDIENKNGKFPFDTVIESLKKQSIKFGDKMTDEPERRAVDWFDRDEINSHLQKFLEHCAVNKINPDLNTIVDWLYALRKYNEPDEFVRIERMIEMVSNQQIFPNLIIQVLKYALDMENQCRKVVNAAESDEFNENSIKEECYKLKEIIKNVY